MADRMAAEIWIGGKLHRSLLEAFPVSDLRLDWDHNRLQSSTEPDILAARDENGLLYFADDEAAWASFRNWRRGCGNITFPFGAIQKVSMNTRLKWSSSVLT